MCHSISSGISNSPDRNTSRASSSDVAVTVNFSEQNR